jgi:endonuclease/exonuclease/phosphatase family metal-dependent hydrolase
MRLLSYNIRGGLGMDDRRSIARIARVIQEQDPDVACLQEVHRRLPWSGLSDQPRLLARHTGLHAVFLPNLRVGVGGYGNCILSREPVLSRMLHLLPSRKEQRGAIGVDVSCRGTIFTILCTHFGLDGEERQAQARQLDEIGRAARYPCLVAGDLNEGPEGPALRWLEAAGWRHAFPPLEPTFTAAAPRVRIDYVLMGAGVRCERGWVASTEASDHLPVGAEVELE